MQRRAEGLVGADARLLTISVVSHGHANFIGPLLADLAKIPDIAQVALTINIPEMPIEYPAAIKDRILEIRNEIPRGFGANHNAAFRYCRTPYFCILNPDVRIPENPFPELVNHFQDLSISLVAPLVVNAAGEIEDSSRRFPTLWNMIARVTGISSGRWRSPEDAHPELPDWVAGILMVVRAESFSDLKGFDEAYFMYCEDVDLCARLHSSGGRVALCTQTRIVHEAQRRSHRNLRYAWWHLRSMIRFFRVHQQLATRGISPLRHL
jgi:GT2 family glycosyltransferase